MENESLLEKDMIIHKFHLDSCNSCIFFPNYFNYLLHYRYINFKSISDIYNEMDKIDTEFQDILHFFPSLFFNFLINEFLFIYLPIHTFIDYFENIDYNIPISSLISQFIDSFMYFPILSIIDSHSLSLEQKNIQCKSLFNFLYLERNIKNARFLTIDIFKHIIQLQKKIKNSFSFHYLLSQYNFNREIKIIDLDGSIIDFKFKKPRFSFHHPNNNISFFYYHPVFSILRPWIKFNSFSIFPINLSSKWISPSFHFHHLYVQKNSFQNKKIWSSHDHQSFLIRYSFNNRLFLQNQYIFNLEKSWYSNPFLYPHSLSHLKNKNDIPYFSDIINHIYLLLSQALSSIITDSRINIPSIIQKILSSLLSIDNPFLYLQKFYHIFGRISQSQPLFFLHSSFLFKLNECYLDWEKLIDLPLEIIFPDFFMAPISLQKKYLFFWSKSQHLFINNLLLSHFKNKFNIKIPIKKKISFDHSLLPFSSSELSLNGIFYNNFIIDIHKTDLFPKSFSSFFNYDILEEGKNMIGIFIDIPYYWNPPNIPTKISSSIISPPIEYISESEMDSFLSKLEFTTFESDNDDIDDDIISHISSSHSDEENPEIDDDYNFLQ